MSAPSDYDKIWSHIDECAECDCDLRRLCSEGRRRLDEATQSTAERMCPMPAVWSIAKPAGPQ